MGRGNKGDPGGLGADEHGNLRAQVGEWAEVASTERDDRKDSLYSL